MQEIDLPSLGGTIVFSDLHLNMLNGKFEELQRQRVKTALNREDPKTVILNGDTVDLFFGFKSGRRGADIETILTENAEFVGLLRDVPNLYLLAGAHDQAVRWDDKIVRTLRACFPNCRGISDGLADLDAKIVVVPGAQWYYDNAVEAGRWLSLTRDLTTAFEDFMLSGILSAERLEAFYLQGRLGFWYRAGSHYEFLQGMARAFGCRTSDYFAAIARICREPYFATWTDEQFYEDYRSVGQMAILLAEDGGPAMEKIAAPYWRMLGRVVKQRLGRYMDAGMLDYPPYPNVPFRTAIVGHTHLAQQYSSQSGRRMLFTGSTKPQTRIDGASNIARNEFGGGYVVIEHETARFERFEQEIWNTDLQLLAADCGNAHWTAVLT